MADPPAVLVTGFEPFDGEPVNPSALLLEGLATRGAAATALLPVDRTRYLAALEQALARERPDVVLALGQASSRRAIDLETTARNALDYEGRRDNGGHAARGETLDEHGPERLHSPLALDAACRRLCARGHPVRVSRDAGSHLCNAVYYALLRRGLRAAFVHVPLLPEQAERRGRGEPSLPLETSRAALADLLALVGHLPGAPRRARGGRDARGRDPV